MMQVKYKTYEKYKDSGIPWIGDIPDGWSIKRAKYVCDIYNGDSLNDSLKSIYESEDKNDYPYISTKDVDLNSSTISYENGLRIPKKSNAYKVAPKNSSLLCIEGGSAGKKSAFLQEDVCFVNKLACFKATEKINSKYLFYYLKSDAFEKQFQLSMSGLIGGVAISLIKRFEITIPNDEEQKCIISFLDQKIAEIDLAIKNKERLVELLKEQKDIIINDAVTKGLNPKVKMKESGIEWIGNIPEHWEVKRAKYLFNEIDERSNDGSEELLSVSHTTGVTPRSDKNVNMFMSEDYSGSKLCKKGDAVFNIMWAWMGALGVSNHEGIVSPSYGVYRPKKKNIFNDWYLEQLLKSSKYVEEYNKRSTGLHSSRLRLYSHMFFAMEMGFPSIDEQNSIEKEVKIKCAVSDDMLIATQLEIEKLKEFRKTLISHAVTGKIRI
jgi:type I restriction enzyme, S subunit